MSDQNNVANKILDSKPSVQAAIELELVDKKNRKHNTIAVELMTAVQESGEIVDCMNLASRIKDQKTRNEIPYYCSELQKKGLAVILYEKSLSSKGTIRKEPLYIKFVPKKSIAFYQGVLNEFFSLLFMIERGSQNTNVRRIDLVLIKYLQRFSVFIDKSQFESQNDLMIPFELLKEFSVDLLTVEMLSENLANDLEGLYVYKYMGHMFLFTPQMVYPTSEVAINFIKRIAIRIATNKEVFDKRAFSFVLDNSAQNIEAIKDKNIFTISSICEKILENTDRAENFDAYLVSNFTILIAKRKIEIEKEKIDTQKRFEETTWQFANAVKDRNSFLTTKQISELLKTNIQKFYSVKKPDIKKVTADFFKSMNTKVPHNSSKYWNKIVYLGELYTHKETVFPLFLEQLNRAKVDAESMIKDELHSFFRKYNKNVKLDANYFEPKKLEMMLKNSLSRKYSPLFYLLAMINFPYFNYFCHEHLKTLIKEKRMLNEAVYENEVTYFYIEGNGTIRSRPLRQIFNLDIAEMIANNNASHNIFFHFILLFSKQYHKLCKLAKLYKSLKKNEDSELRTQQANTMKLRV